MPEPAALVQFRQYLKKQYGSLEKLNASWERKYGSWEEVVPLLTKDLTPATRNLAPWVDLRLFVSDRSFEIDKFNSAKVRAALGEDVAIGIDGWTSSSAVVPYAGTDAMRLFHEGVLTSYCPYEDDFMIASTLKGKLTKYIGWAMSKEEYLGNPCATSFAATGEPTALPTPPMPPISAG